MVLALENWLKFVFCFFPQLAQLPAMDLVKPACRASGKVPGTRRFEGITVFEEGDHWIIAVHAAIGVGQPIVVTCGPTTQGRGIRICLLRV